jgi:hypothetical protein
MSYEGLIAGYDVDRPLTEEEHENHLLQNVPSRSPPNDRLSVIKMNSTFLECCDKFHESRGEVSAVFLTLSFGMLFLWLAFAFSFHERDSFGNTFLFLTIILSVILLVFWFVFLRRELFVWTHYPIRFNRKTRQVHVFRRDGTVMTESWDKLYFALCECKSGNYEVRCHRLANDGETVLETFGLPYDTTYDSDEEEPEVYSQWEFVRRYMEEGPEKLLDGVKFTMNIAEQRESFYDGYQRLGEGAPALLFVLLSPLIFYYGIGRWLSMLSSKIPHWPSEIEEQCRVEQGDIYELER